MNVYSIFRIACETSPKTANRCVRSEVVTAVSVNITVPWDVTLCTDIQQREGKASGG
jgi:hypothetical protein